MKLIRSILIASSIATLAACSSSQYSRINYQGQLNDPIIAITLLSEQQREWAGTPYRIGGMSMNGVDCSGFVQLTFKDRFGIKLPRTTTEQANYGQKIGKDSIQTGDLVFLKPGSDPMVIMWGFMSKTDNFYTLRRKAV